MSSTINPIVIPDVVVVKTPLGEGSPKANHADKIVTVPQPLLQPIETPQINFTATKIEPLSEPIKPEPNAQGPLKPGPDAQGPAIKNPPPPKDPKPLPVPKKSEAPAPKPKIEVENSGESENEEGGSGTSEGSRRSNGSGNSEGSGQSQGSVQKEAPKGKSLTPNSNSKTESEDEQTKKTKEKKLESEDDSEKKLMPKKGVEKTEGTTPPVVVIQKNQKSCKETLVQVAFVVSCLVLALGILGFIGVPLGGVVGASVITAFSGAVALTCLALLYCCFKNKQPQQHVVKA